MRKDDIALAAPQDPCNEVLKYRRAREIVGKKDIAGSRQRIRAQQQLGHSAPMREFVPINEQLVPVQPIQNDIREDPENATRVAAFCEKYAQVVRLCSRLMLRHAAITEIADKIQGDQGRNLAKLCETTSIVNRATIIVFHTTNQR